MWICKQCIYIYMFVWDKYKYIFACRISRVRGHYPLQYYLILQDRARFQTPWPQTWTHQLESPWGLIVPMWRQNVHQTQIKEQKTFARPSSRLANSVVVSLTQYSRLLTNMNMFIEDIWSGLECARMYECFIVFVCPLAVAIWRVLCEGPRPTRHQPELATSLNHDPTCAVLLELVWQTWTDSTISWRWWRCNKASCPLAIHPKPFKRQK